MRVVTRLLSIKQLTTTPYHPMCNGLTEKFNGTSIEDIATGPNLTDEQQNEFKDLAKQFTNLFTEAPGTTDLVQHHIKLTSDEPVRSRPYPVPYSMRESLRKDIADMIKMGVT